MRVVDRVNALVQGYAAGKRVELGFALSQGIADNHRKSVGNVAFAQVDFYFFKIPSFDRRFDYVKLDRSGQIGHQTFDRNRRSVENDICVKRAAGQSVNAAAPAVPADDNALDVRPAAQSGPLRNVQFGLAADHAFGMFADKIVQFQHPFVQRQPARRFGHGKVVQQKRVRRQESVDVPVFQPVIADMRLTQTGFDDESRRFRRIAEIGFVVLLIDVIEKFLKLKTIELKVGFNLVAAVFFLIGKTAGKTVGADVDVQLVKQRDAAAGFDGGGHFKQPQRIVRRIVDGKIIQHFDETGRPHFGFAVKIIGVVAIGNFPVIGGVNVPQTQNALGRCAFQTAGNHPGSGKTAQFVEIDIGNFYSELAQKSDRIADIRLIPQVLDLRRLTETAHFAFKGKVAAGHAFDRQVVNLQHAVFDSRFHC